MKWTGFKKNAHCITMKAVYLRLPAPKVLHQFFYRFLGTWVQAKDKDSWEEDSRTVIYRPVSIFP